MWCTLTHPHKKTPISTQPLTVTFCHRNNSALGQSSMRQQWLKARLSATLDSRLLCIQVHTQHLLASASSIHRIHIEMGACPPHPLPPLPSAFPQSHQSGYLISAEQDNIGVLQRLPIFFFLLWFCVQVFFCKIVWTTEINYIGLCGCLQDFTQKLHTGIHLFEENNMT